MPGLACAYRAISMSNGSGPTRQDSPTVSSRLIQYFCPLCGLFIAASPNPEVLKIAVLAHACLNL